jgi:hypothetical protein
MILKLTEKEVTEAVLEWANKRMDYDFQEHIFNAVDFKYSTIHGCEVSWVEPAKAETENV